MSYVFSFTFFSRPLVFTLHWWSIAFLILSLPLQNFDVVLPTKKCLLFYISRSRPPSPFFSLSFAGLPPTSTFSLSLRCSIFQICEPDNYCTQHGYRNNFRFPFSSLLTLLLSLLYKTPVAMRFPPKVTSSCIWVTIPVD